MNQIIVDYNSPMTGLAAIPVYVINEEKCKVQSYSLTNEWEHFKDALSDLCYAADIFDVSFYVSPQANPFTLDGLKQEFQQFEHKKYCNGANINIHLYEKEKN